MDATRGVAEDCFIIKSTPRWNSVLLWIVIWLLCSSSTGPLLTLTRPLSLSLSPSVSTTFWLLPEKHLALLSVAPWVVLPFPSIAISLYFFEYSANTFIQFRNRFSGIPSVGSSADSPIHRLIHQWYLGRWIVGGGGGSGMG